MERHKSALTVLILKLKAIPHDAFGNFLEDSATVGRANVLCQRAHGPNPDPSCIHLEDVEEARPDRKPGDIFCTRFALLPVSTGIGKRQNLRPKLVASFASEARPETPARPMAVALVHRKERRAAKD